ncbi:MAG: DUF2249 domain-containing protein [Bacteroidota bacterium]
MKINEQTRVSDLIKFNEASIDAIASINKHFTKLKNPILRKVLAKRVSIADAAKVGGTTVEDFYKVLRPLGFESEIIDFNKEIKPNTEYKVSDMDINNIDPSKLTELDVRDEIAGGNDPFVIIMDALKKMPEDNTLKLINIFEPIPLINKLNKKGYSTFVDTSVEGMVVTYFHKEQDMEIEEETRFASKDTFEKVKGFYGDKIVEIDVRDLEMPEPMVQTLANAENLKEGYALYVNHKKVPQYLIPELEERGMKFLIYEIEEGNVKLLIFR